ncbi:hypothetical protein MNBD_GAMMA12-1133 [hydrothermal vent metagenome]|uniref:Uncharacterized protein n=1 Tax=hydrothermal vent metagenome TaxID=652676 RepID=A0A3B0YRQ7_9ZZZZ
MMGCTTAANSAISAASILSVFAKWVSELNKLGMDCEIHPEFLFETQTGFLPFKVNIKENSHEALMNREYLTGFEYYLDDFNLEENTEYLEKSFFQKLLKKPKEKKHFHTKEIYEQLQDKKYIITFNFGISDTLELRMASLASVTLSKLANGVCCYADDNIWYDNTNIIENALNDVTEYEKSLRQREFRLHGFEEWL